MIVSTRVSHLATKIMNPSLRWTVFLGVLSIHASCSIFATDQAPADQRTDSVFATGGVTFAPTSNLVFDAGVAVGLSHEAPDFQILSGLTYIAGRLLQMFQQDTATVSRMLEA